MQSSILTREEALTAVNEIYAGVQQLEGYDEAVRQAEQLPPEQQISEVLGSLFTGRRRLARPTASLVRQHSGLMQLGNRALNGKVLDALTRIAAVHGLPAETTSVYERFASHYNLPDRHLTIAILEDLTAEHPLRMSINMSRENSWAPYACWNEVLADLVFHEGNAGRPVYLDVEGVVLQEAAKLIWPAAPLTAAAAETAFCSAVRRTVFEYGGSDQDDRISFSLQVHRLREWSEAHAAGKADPHDPPPCIGLLTILALAAEQMRTDGEMASTNYYGRLADVLSMPLASKDQIARAYRPHARRLWNGLNTWLHGLHGRRGLPTAHEFGPNEYISLPLSQALIRAEERQQLPDLFDYFKLSPGESIARDDLYGMVERWCREAAPASLHDLWQSRQETRDQITALVATELELWNGDLPESGDGQGHAQTIRCYLAAAWYEEPEPEFEPLVIARAGQPKVQQTLAAGGAMEGEEGLRLEPWTDSYVRVTADDEAQFEQLVAMVTGSGEADSARPLLVLQLDDLSSMYVETNRAELGRALLLLVRQGHWRRVQPVLEMYAAPGFQRLEDFREGVPAGWELVIGVRLQRIAPRLDDDFEALQPRSRLQIQFADGMQLTNARWHSASPPQLEVADAAHRAFSVALERQTNAEEDPLPLGQHHGACRLDLSPYQLPDGDYRVIVAGRDRGDLLATRALRLRSSRSRHLDRPHQFALGYAADPDFTARSALSAEPLPDSSDGWLQGGAVDLRPPLQAFPELPAGGEPFVSQPIESQEGWVKRTFGEVTEAGLEEAQALIKRGYVALNGDRYELTERGWRMTTRQGTATNRRTAPTGSRQRRLDLDLDQILDALVVCGAGSWQAFRRLIDHSETERYKPDEALRNLRSLGHLDVELEHRTARPRRWSVPPAALAQPSRTQARAFLTGRRDPRLLERLQTEAAALGAEVNATARDGQPVRWEVKAEHSGILSQVAAAAALPLHSDVPRRLLERLPTVRAVWAQQPELHLPADAKLERFTPASNRWLPFPEHTLLAGAYRFEGRQTLHGIYADGGWRECGGLFAKYAGAAVTGDNIMHYEAETQEFSCKFGARPPGLYERALILCSGELPRIEDGRMVYREVPTEAAAWLIAKLGPQGWSADCDH